MPQTSCCSQVCDVKIYHYLNVLIITIYFLLQRCSDDSQYSAVYMSCSLNHQGNIFESQGPHSHILLTRGLSDFFGSDILAKSGDFFGSQKKNRDFFGLQKKD